MTLTTASEARASAIPGLYWGWLSALSLSLIASRSLAFCLVWMATGDGAAAAALVLLANSLPRIAVSLFAGALIDRRGAFKVMLTADCLMVVVCAVFFAVTLHSSFLPVWIALAACMGLAEGFYIPASGSVPKLLVPSEQLPRAMAGQQLANQASSVLSPVLGGLIAVGLGIPLATAIALFGYLLMAVLLLASRAWKRVPVAAPSRPQSLAASLVQGWRTMLGAPMLRTTLLVTVLFMLLMPPITSFFVPLVARSNGWSANLAGLITAGFAAGMVVVAAAVLWKGSVKRPGIAVGVGVLVLGLAAAGLSQAAHPAVVLSCAVLGGVGASLFSTHLGPLFVGSAPMESIGRMQALMSLAQSLPLLVGPLLLGPLVEVVPAPTMLVIWAALLVLLAGGVILSPTMRHAVKPGKQGKTPARTS